FSIISCIKKLIFLLLLSLCNIFFFFQAEDGIRDRNVTGVQTCALPILAFVPASQWQMLLTIYIFSAIGYSVSNLFYDSFLTDLADDLQMNKISTYGYAFGYLGGVLAFILFLIMQLTSGFGMLDGVGIAKMSFIIAASWWLIFYLPLQRNVTQKYSVTSTKSPVSGSFKRVFATIRHIRQ